MILKRLVTMIFKFAKKTYFKKPNTFLFLTITSIYFHDIQQKINNKIDSTLSLFSIEQIVKICMGWCILITD